MNFNKNLFICAHQIGDRTFYPTYRKLVQSQWDSYSKKKKDQEKELRHMINFAYRNVPYYFRLFNQLKLEPSDIKTVEDLEKLPILTKEIIKENWEDFKPINLNKMKYGIETTGGSTGNPFLFRVLRHDRFISGAMLYRGWGYANYELGDKMVFLAGSALGMGFNSSIVKRSHEISRNIRKLSSFDMSIDDMRQQAKIINSFKPKFIRGYASSINFFASYIHENDIEIITPRAIFTTAEKLTPYMRKNIEEAFGCEVYDTYGLNDGGVTSYECPEHQGLHIDTERSIMEIVNNKAMQLENGFGEILATSLHNYAMPFIRYDTGDVGHIINENCGCGRKSKLLKEIIGRSVDFLLTPDGKYIHGNFLLYIFDDYWKNIKEYQIIQERINRLVIKIVPEEKFDEKSLGKIKEIISNKCNDWEVEFKYVDKIERTKAGKYKYVISNLVQ